MEEKLILIRSLDRVSSGESNFLLEDFQTKSHILLLLDCCKLLVRMGFSHSEDIQGGGQYCYADAQTEHQLDQREPRLADYRLATGWLLSRVGNGLTQSHRCPT
jgi:hypothetical protein